MSSVTKLSTRTMPFRGSGSIRRSPPRELPSCSSMPPENARRRISRKSPRQTPPERPPREYDQSLAQTDAARAQVDEAQGRLAEANAAPERVRVSSKQADTAEYGTGSRFSPLPPQNATGNYVKVVQRIPVKILFDEPPDAHLLAPGMSVVPDVDVGAAPDPSAIHYGYGTGGGSMEGTSGGGGSGFRRFRCQFWRFRRKVRNNAERRRIKKRINRRNGRRKS